MPDTWRLDQLVPIKEATRSLPKLIERNEPLVLTRRSEPVAVLVPVAQFEADGAEAALSSLIEAAASPTGLIRLYAHQHAEAGSGEDWQRMAEWGDQIRDGLKAARKAMGWDIESLTDGSDSTDG